MSRLDLLSQTMPRPVDAQSRNASMNPEAQENSGNAAASDFGSLLEDFSGKAKKQDTTASQRDASLLSIEAAEVSLESDISCVDSLQALLPEVLPSDNAADTSSLQSGSPVFSILENLLPRVLAQPSQGGSSDPRQPGTSLATAYLSMPQSNTGKSSSTNSGLGSKLAVSVQNQEAHFRPIIDGLGGDSTDLSPSFGEETGQLTGSPLADKSKDTGRRSHQPPHSDGLTRAVADMAVEAEIARKSEEQEIARGILPDRTSERADVPKQPPTGGAKAESAFLPTSTLQHLAKSILEDAKSSSEPQQPSFQHDGLNRAATARASAGVLRVLDLQLKPAELGLVTIKMRLAGDSIEMEIHAQSEETAELLRNDAEKLSSLLRVSGYRPDVINIQSTEAASHDRSSFQRSQQGDQMQSPSFDQGAASGNGSSSRHQDDYYSRGGSDVQKDGKESLPPGGSLTGGIYL